MLAPNTVKDDIFDVTYDCRADAGGKDPDSHSQTLRQSHQFLWSKELPSGKRFDLDISGPKPFLVHRSSLGEFMLTSDSITHTYSARRGIEPFIDQLPERSRKWAQGAAWYVAESIIFPGKRIDRKNTINGARGMNSRIGDRFDLTLECIRRYYIGGQSPLSDVIHRYSTFFDLFESFEGYVSFFFLQDLVDDSSDLVKFYLPFDDFVSGPVPSSLSSYARYVEAIVDFSNGRAERMLAWSRSHAASHLQGSLVGSITAL